MHVITSQKDALFVSNSEFVQFQLLLGSLPVVFSRQASKKRDRLPKLKACTKVVGKVGRKESTEFRVANQNPVQPTKLLLAVNL